MICFNFSPTGDVNEQFVLRLEKWQVHTIRTQKKRGAFSIFSLRGVWHNLGRRISKSPRY